MSYRYDDSYPFFNIARRFEVDYGDVLAYAELGQDGRVNYDGLVGDRGARHVDAHHPTLAERIPYPARLQILELCALPVAQRGGRTDVCDACGVTNKLRPEGQRTQFRCEWRGLAGQPSDCMALTRVHQC